MSEGSIYLVIDFPRPWPVQAPLTLFSFPQGTSTVKMLALPQGHLNFVVEAEKDVLVNYYSQPLEFQGVGQALLIAAWKGSDLSLRINAHELSNQESAQGVPCRIELRRQVINATPSFAYPETVQACKDWMEWRKNKYANPKAAAKQHRRLKTKSEQISELRDALFSLVDIATLIQQGKYHLIGHLATELRALVYWNGKNYSPLLLRMAGRFALPLPLFAIPEAEDVPDVISQANLYFRPGGASIIKEVPTQILVDLQKWLSTTVVTMKIPRGSGGSVTVEEDVKSVKDIILDTATVLGSAHYDEDLPDTLEVLYSLKGPVGSVVVSLLLNTASITVSLGQYVIDQINT